MAYQLTQLIKKKRQGQPHDAAELAFILRSYVNGTMPDYQMAAWLMSVYFQGMSAEELATYTRLMRDSGHIFRWHDINGPLIDKHSTGGVGDKTTLIVAPLVAAAGINMPSIVGRGLGHTGGTLDKLESLPGFRGDLSEQAFSQAVKANRMAIIGQTAQICPADKKIYALRDVTATVDSLPLICGSIMSKKLAEGLDALVLDVKCGSGAFMKTADEAIELARRLKETGEQNQLKVHALITNMETPLGRFVGNALEIKECLDILQGRDDPFYATTRDLSLQLAAHMILLGGLATDLIKARGQAERLLASGQAYKRFCQFLKTQGHPDLKQLPEAAYTIEYLSKKAGYLTHIDTEGLGLAAIQLKAGRQQTDDLIDPATGLEMCVRVGEKISLGQRILIVHTNDRASVASVQKQLDQCFFVGAQKPAPLPLIHTVMM